MLRKSKVKCRRRLKSDNKNLENDLQNAEQNWKELNKLNNMKDKEVHDLKKENKQLIENLDMISNELKNLTNQVNEKKKSEFKKLKVNKVEALKADL